ncbi:MAG: 50S ribosomal protein L17 [Candidatus Anammoxibacter sp.]
MRHRIRGRQLSRTSSHRKALRRNLASSLFESGRIITTLPKAKEVKSFAEKLITLAKKAIAEKNKDNAAYVHKYRQAISKLQNKDMVKKLFGEGEWRENGGIAAQYLQRNGGYTRILKLAGSRLGAVSGSAIGKIPEMKYKFFDVERKIKLVGNRLGDNATLVIFELVEGDDSRTDDDEEIKPVVNVEEKK